MKIVFNFVFSAMLMFSLAAEAIVINIPANDADGNFTISWSQPSSYGQLHERINGVWGASIIGGTTISYEVTNKPHGTYYYNIKDCLVTGGQGGSITNCTDNFRTVIVGPPPQVAPTISNITDRSINQNSNTGDIPFTITDPDSSSFSLGRSSSNQALAPDANITFGGSGNNRTVRVTPVTGQYGSATITVSVSDGGLTATDTFVVTVNPLPATASGSFNVASIKEGESAVYSWSSTNATSCSATGISGVSAASGSVTYTAPAEVLSVQTVSVSLTCTGAGGNSSSSLASLQVNPDPDAPTISNITDRSINQNSNTGDVAFSISDPDSSTFTPSGSSSNQTLVPNANITFGGSGTNRTVRVTPVTGQYGSATITVTVSDGALTATDTFVVTVNPLPATASGSFNVASIKEGESAVYTWSSTNATSCSATGISGVSATSDSITYTAPAEVSSVQTVSVSLICTGAGGNSSPSSASLQVNPDPDAPTISNITDRSINQNSNTGDIAFTIADPDSSSFTPGGSSSNTTLVPNANITFGGSGNNRTVRVTPVTGQYGSSTISVTVSDGALTATDTFVVTVVPLVPTASGSFNTSPINEAGSSVYTWSSVNATSCSATGISGVSATSGSITYTAPTEVLSEQNLSVVLTCTGPWRHIPTIHQ